MPTDRGDNRDGRAVDAGETNAYPAEGGGNGAYPTAASSHANERTGQAEWGSEFVGGSPSMEDASC